MSKGEAGRLGGLYAAHGPEAVRLAFLMTGDRALAEDLAQEAFVRMFGRFRDLRRPEAFRWYLRKTVVNLARSHFRRRRVERAYLDREGAPAPVVPEHDHGEREEMWTALQRLPARQRAALVLRFYEDLGEADIAEVLQCPVGTVKSLISRGVARLREELTR